MDHFWTMRPPKDKRDPRNIRLHHLHTVELPKFKNPKSPCFLVQDRFFRLFGAQVGILLATENTSNNDVRSIELVTNTSIGYAQHLKDGDHFNIYDRHHPISLRRSVSFETMTADEIDECARDYIRIPRNMPYGYRWEWFAKDGSMGDTYLASKVQMKKRYPPEEENQIPYKAYTKFWEKRES